MKIVVLLLTLFLFYGCSEEDRLLLGFKEDKSGKYTKNVSPKRKRTRAYITVIVTAKKNQWAYQYRLWNKKRLTVSGTLILPTGVDIRLVVTSTHGSHQWEVKSLKIESAAEPNMWNKFWLRIRKGVTQEFKGNCSIWCTPFDPIKEEGGHCYTKKSHMPISVKTVSEQEFTKLIQKLKQKTRSTVPLSKTTH